MMPWGSSPDLPIAEQAAGLAAIIAAAENRAAAGDSVDLASLALLIDEVTTKVASSDPQARQAAQASLLALLEGASSLVDTLDRRTGELRGQLVDLRHGRDAGRAYRTSSRLQR